ncbi:protein NRT1/ PTR FAMILY 8.3-like [Miscanthus floridulus]|uniref:protein NRT1/ PTR FAMILY 8.3-like n=1 Tax=Miscanthus floridulus TaxID=154761 RepID=UPI00345A6163
MPTGSPLKDIIWVLVTAVRKRNVRMERDDGAAVLLKEDDANDDGEQQLLSRTKGQRCLDNAAVIVVKEQEGEWSLCTVSEVEGMKILVRMLPIWVTCHVCAVRGVAGADDHHLHPAGDGHGHAAGRVVQGARGIVGVRRGGVRAPVGGAARRRHHPGGAAADGAPRRADAAAAHGTAALVERRRLRAIHGGSGPMTGSDVFCEIAQLEFFYGEDPVAMRSICSAFPSWRCHIGKTSAT